MRAESVPLGTAPAVSWKRSRRQSLITVLGSQTAAVNVAAAAVGVGFLILGVLGFVPGVTTHLGQLTFAGHTSDARLLGLFEVSALHSLVHLLFGVVGLAAGRSTRLSARRFLLGGGLVYLVLWVYGLAVGENATANFVPVNTADNWLHLGLAAAMIALGVVNGSVAKRRLSL
jgi:Domain of unknown function (DUF4383)